MPYCDDRCTPLKSTAAHKQPHTHLHNCTQRLRIYMGCCHSACGVKRQNTLHISAPIVCSCERGVGVEQSVYAYCTVRESIGRLRCEYPVSFTNDRLVTLVDKRILRECMRVRVCVYLCKTRIAPNPSACPIARFPVHTVSPPRNHPH